MVRPSTSYPNLSCLQPSKSLQGPGQLRVRSHKFRRDNHHEAPCATSRYSDSSVPRRCVICRVSRCSCPTLPNEQACFVTRLLVVARLKFYRTTFLWYWYRQEDDWLVNIFLLPLHVPVRHRVYNDHEPSFSFLLLHQELFFECLPFCPATDCYQHTSGA